VQSVECAVTQQSGQLSAALRYATRLSHAAAVATTTHAHAHPPTCRLHRQHADRRRSRQRTPRTCAPAPPGPPSAPHRSCGGRAGGRRCRGGIGSWSQWMRQHPLASPGPTQHTREQPSAARATTLPARDGLAGTAQLVAVAAAPRGLAAELQAHAGPAKGAAAAAAALGFGCAAA
jgi:hypothetical protein